MYHFSWTTINLDEVLSYIGPTGSSSSTNSVITYDNGDYYSGLIVGIHYANSVENVNAGSGDDAITCSISTNVINCGAGDDWIHSIAAGDTVNGNEGDDVFFVTNNSFTLIDGGSGNDAIVLSDTYSVNADGDIDLRDFADAQLTGIEIIDIQNSTTTDLIITKQFITDYLEGTPSDLDSDGDTDNIVYIDVESSDKVFVPVSDNWSFYGTISSYRFYSTDSNDTWFATTLSAGAIVTTFSGSFPSAASPAVASYAQASNHEFSNDNFADGSIILAGDYFAASAMAAEDNPLSSSGSESFAESLTLPDTAPVDGPSFALSEEDALSLLSELIDLNPSDLIDDESLLLADLSGSTSSDQPATEYAVEATDLVADLSFAGHYDGIMDNDILVGVSELG